MGERNPMKRPEVARAVSKTIREKWGKAISRRVRKQWRDGRMHHVWERGPLHVSPNKAELELAAVIAGITSRIRYTGNFAFWIGPCASGKRRNPDFIDGPRRLTILLNGEYWHSQKDTEIEMNDYKSKGWRVLVIWTHELKRKNRDRLTLKIRTFLSKPSSTSASSDPAWSATSQYARATRTSLTR